MVVTKTDESLCVELDTGTNADDYLKYIKKFDGKPNALKFDLAQSVYNSEADYPKDLGLNIHSVLSSMKY